MAPGAVQRLAVDPQTGQVDEAGSLPLPEGALIPHRQAVLSPDGGTLFVGTAGGPRPCIPSCSAGDLVDGAVADTVRAYSTTTWKEIRHFRLRHGFIGLATVRGGRDIVTVSPVGRTVTFSDAATIRTQSEQCSQALTEPKEV